MTVIITSAESLKSLFVHAKFLGTHFVQTKRVRNKVYDASLISIIKRQRAAHRNCSQTLGGLVESFESRPNCRPKNQILLEVFNFRWVDIRLLCRQIAKLEQLDCERVFVAASANSCYSMLGLGNLKNDPVKITILIQLVQKLFWCFFVN